MKLVDYSLQPTTRLKAPQQILFWTCREKKECFKISKMPQKNPFKTDVTVQNFRQKLTPRKMFSANVLKYLEIYREKVFKGRSLKAF